jgi:hypothetical protein
MGQARLLMLFGVACALARPCGALAWSDDGHKIVGLVAEHYLDAAVRARVDALLAGDTTRLVSPLDIPDEATWADKYRDSDRNSTHARYDQTQHWHYVDLEIGGTDADDLDTACNHRPPVPAGTPASAGSPDDCVVDKIDEFAAELADPATSSGERRTALQFVLHFVGDMHQPLHASDNGDQGGNAVVVHGNGVGTNLHGTWDTQLVTSLGAGDAAIANALIAAITPALQAQWSHGATADWAQEAYLLAKSEAYGKLPAPNADHSYTLDAAYVSNAQQIVRLQLSRAGVRLAAVLQRAMGTASPPPPPSSPSASASASASATASRRSCSPA